MRSIFRVYLIFFLSICHYAGGQTKTDFQRIFSLFDSYKYEDLDVALDLVDINELPSKTYNDSINV